MREVQKKLKVRLSENKEAYRRKPDSMFKQSSAKEQKAGIRQIASFKAKQQPMGAD